MICVGDSWKETIKAETVIIYGSKMNCVLYNFMGCYLFSKFRRVNTYENFFFFFRDKEFVVTLSPIVSGRCGSSVEMLTLYLIYKCT